MAAVRQVWLRRLIDTVQVIALSFSSDEISTGNSVAQIAAFSAPQNPIEWYFVEAFARRFGDHRAFTLGSQSAPGAGRGNFERRSLCPPDIEIAARAKAIMDAEFATPILIRLIALRLGTTRNRLTTAFSAAFGITPHAYLAELRLRSAIQLLATSQLKVENIPQMVGLTDRSAFSKSFRSAIGMTPATARRVLHRLSGANGHTKGASDHTN